MDGPDSWLEWVGYFALCYLAGHSIGWVLYKLHKLRKR